MRIRAKQILFDLEPGQKLAGEDKEIVRQYRRAPGAVAAELFQMKVPMRNKKNCDFSYAGLKNSFRMAVGASTLVLLFIYLLTSYTHFLDSFFIPLSSLILDSNQPASSPNTC